MTCYPGDEQLRMHSTHANQTVCVSCSDPVTSLLAGLQWLASFTHAQTSCSHAGNNMGLWVATFEIAGALTYDKASGQQGDAQQCAPASTSTHLGFKTRPAGFHYVQHMLMYATAAVQEQHGDPANVSMGFSCNVQK